MRVDLEQAQQTQQVLNGHPGPRLALAATWAYAFDFLKAAESHRASTSDFKPAQLYLACHALELALKTYLALQGWPIATRERATSRADLLSLLAQADSHGLDKLVPLSPQQHAEVKKAAAYYSGMVLEYPALVETVRGFPQRPDADSLMTLSNNLLSAIGRKIRALI